MHVVFRDENGDEGRVTEGLDVVYDGRWAAEVRQYVADVEAAHRTDQGVAVEAVFEKLVVEMPERLPVRSVERRAD